MLSAAVTERVRSWVVYRDPHILVLNKPSGLSVQGGSKLTHSLANYLAALKFDAHDTPRLVHRLVGVNDGLGARAELFLGSTRERGAGVGAHSSSGSKARSHVVRTQTDATVLGRADWSAQVRAIYL